MKSKKELEKDDEYQAECDFKNTVEEFKLFNAFIIRLQERVKFPFSKEIYGISSRNYKFQISIAMIIAGIYKEKLKDKDLLYKILEDDDERDKFIDILSKSLINSFLEDSEYNASSTNSKKIKELIDNINI